jgi:hypothetical protein
MRVPLDSNSDLLKINPSETKTTKEDYVPGLSCTDLDLTLTIKHQNIG